MTQRKCTSVLCLSALALFFLTTERAVSSDSFLDFSQNAYSLSKVFTRPLLQPSHIPQVWQTDSKSDTFRRAVLEGLSPEISKRQFRAHAWQQATEDVQWDFESLVVKDQEAEKRAIADTVEDLVPIIEDANDRMADYMESLNRDYDLAQVASAQKDVFQLSKQLADFHSFVNMLKEMAPMDADMAAVEECFEKNELKERKIIIESRNSFLTDDILSDAEQIYSFETQGRKEMHAVDETVLSLLFNDLLDLSTGVNSLVWDSAYPPDEKVENTYRSASLLDRAKKTDQIQENPLFAARRDLIERLKNIMKSGRIKGAK